MPTCALAAEGVSFTNSSPATRSCAEPRGAADRRVRVRNGVRALGGVLGGAPVFRLAGSVGRRLRPGCKRRLLTGLFGSTSTGMLRDGTHAGPGAPSTAAWRDAWRGMTSPEHFGGVLAELYVDRRAGVPTVSTTTPLIGSTARTCSPPSSAPSSPMPPPGRPFMAVLGAVRVARRNSSFSPKPAARHFGFLPRLPPWQPVSLAEATCPTNRATTVLSSGRSMSSFQRRHSPQRV